ncbi:MAG: PIN domain-containing protein [Chloroflexota bacterium]
MKVLLDTSILVAAIIEAHPAHSLALPWLQRAKEKAYTGLIAAHSLAELYAILTTLPVQPRIPPDLALQLIQQNILDVLEVVSISGKDYISLIEHLSSRGIVGGATYDALILHSASNANVDQVVTLNEKDFQRVYPSLANKIISP